MKLGPADIPKLQYSLLAALLMATLGTFSILFSLDRVKLANTAFAAAQSERNEFDGKLRRVRSEENEIRQKAALFKTLQARGMIGEEPRLEWVELLNNIRNRHQLLEMNYEIAPQRVLENSPPGQLALYASTMRLQISLLHEEDLIRLLDDLRQQAKALIQIKRCDVSRLPGTGSNKVTPAFLQAECLIDWITLRESPNKQEKP